MKKENGVSIAAVIIAVVVFAVIVWGPQIPVYEWYNPQESLPHLSAPGLVPGEQVNATIIGNLSMSVSGSFYTMQPHFGPSTFDFTIDVNVNNTGETPVTNFCVVKVTMFYENSSPIYTFGVDPYTNFTIQGNSTWVREYRNDRDMISIPSSLISADHVFARILLTFDIGNEIILTTPQTWLPHSVE